MTDGQPRSVRTLLTLSAVRSRRHSYHSQADSAGSIPVTRFTREQRCSTIELGDSSFPLIRVLGPCSGHYGPHISTVQDSSFSFTRRSAYSVMFSGCSVPRSSNVTRGVSPQVRARCERARLQRREESPPVIPCAHRRVKHRGARPVDHRRQDGRWRSLDSDNPSGLPPQGSLARLVEAGNESGFLRYRRPRPCRRLTSDHGADVSRCSVASTGQRGIADEGLRRGGRDHHFLAGGQRAATKVRAIDA
jgi:hypothetical protein